MSLIEAKKTAPGKSDKFYLYKMVNLLNSKVYIGVSNFPKKRIAYHLNKAAKNKGFYIHSAIRKYGENNFTFEIVEIHNFEYKALEREKYYIKILRSNDRNFGYNLTIGGEGNCAVSGSKNHLAKLNEIKVKEIIYKYISGNSSKSLAQEYSVTKKVISDILNFKQWLCATKELPEDIKNKVIETKFNNIHDGSRKSGKNSPSYGKKRTQETKDKLSKARGHKDYRTIEGKERTRQFVLGEKNHGAKLNNNIVLKIRNKYISGESRYNLSKLYNISYSTVKRIINRELWKHI